ncbi:hypothetical protein FQN60_001656 [Etheostoma spectabile]|uniref:Major facilitator superfamily (MFS) profile domain-containing protein n=1 Tax=Etheostoma spectabile TaxID=54343 RepID=A0A5J5D197_9PERO|nr:hypothetical protein FQN60_001656 [Etheostoma spectabile]
MATVPPGIRLLVSFNRDQWYRALTFILTFLLYTSFHLSRKPISIVKSELHKNCSSVNELATIVSSSSGSGQPPSPPSLHTDMDCSWKPFDKKNYKQLLGTMDYSFLCAYAVGMYLSGIIGERLPIRLFLTVGMLTSGLFTCLFGLGYVYNIHNLGFYIFVQVANGLVQTTGWPSVVTCISNWFGKGRRGLIMGLWNSHTSVGNILGSLIAGYWVSSNWGMSFIVPGIIIAVMGIVCFFFLIEHPNDLKSIHAQSSSPGKSSNQELDWCKWTDRDEYYCYEDRVQNRKVSSCGASMSYDTELLLPRDSVCVPAQPVVVVKRESEPSAISFMGALRIPGVIEFSLCLLFAKLVSYTFLFWLPLYITKAAHLDAKKAGDLSTLFDVGGIVGGILAGVISDKLGKRATTCAVMLLLAAPTLYGFSMISEFGLGPTIGAALGPLLAGLLSAGGWDRVFYMLMTADFLALLLLLRLVSKELTSTKSRPISAVEVMFLTALLAAFSTTGWLNQSNSWHGVALSLSWRWQVSSEMILEKMGIRGMVTHAQTKKMFVVKRCLMRRRHLVCEHGPPGCPAPALPTMPLPGWLVVLHLHSLFQLIPYTNTNVV